MKKSLILSWDKSQTDSRSDRFSFFIQYQSHRLHSFGVGGHIFQTPMGYLRSNSNPEWQSDTRTLYVRGDFPSGDCFKMHATAIERNCIEAMVAAYNGFDFENWPLIKPDIDVVHRHLANSSLGSMHPNLFFYDNQPSVPIPGAYFYISDDELEASGKLSWSSTANLYRIFSYESYVDLFHMPPAMEYWCLRFSIAKLLGNEEKLWGPVYLTPRDLTADDRDVVFIRIDDLKRRARVYLKTGDVTQLPLDADNPIWNDLVATTANTAYRMLARHVVARHRRM